MAPNTKRTNVYRDRDALVVPLEGSVFPDRCVKTNEPAEANYEFVDDLLSTQMRFDQGQSNAQVVLQALFGEAADILKKKRLKLRIGLCAEKKARAKKRKLYGIGAIIAGPVVAMTLTMIGVKIYEARHLEPPVWLLLAGCGTMVPILIFGIILFALSSKGTLQIMHSDGKYVWLSGASPEYLAGLPEFPRAVKVNEMNASSLLQ